MRHALVVVLLAAAALTACGKEDAGEMGLTNWEKAPPLQAGPDQDGTPPADVQTAAQPGAPAAAGASAGAPAVATPAAAPGTTPVRKAGLWKTTANNGRGGPQTGELCVDDSSERTRGLFAQMGGGRGGQGCEPKIAKQGAGWTATTACTREFGDASVQMKSSQTLTGDLSKSYQLKGTTTTSGGPNEEMNGTRNTSASGTYAGACPAGMKAGDFKGADGQIRQQGQGRGPGGGSPGGGFGGGRPSGNGG